MLFYQNPSLGKKKKKKALGRVRGMMSLIDIRHPKTQLTIV